MYDQLLAILSHPFISSHLCPSNVLTLKNGEVRKVCYVCVVLDVL